MLNYLAIIFFISIILLIIFLKEKFIYIIPIVLVLLDVFFLEFTFRGYNFSDIKSIIVLITLLYLLFHNKIKYFNKNIWIILFLFYSAFKIFDSQNYMRSVLNFIVINGGFLMFFAGYTNINSIFKLHKLNKSLCFILFIFIINYVVSNIFLLGDDAYNIGNYGGNLTRERSFVISLVIILLPLILRLEPIKKYRIIYSIFSVLSALIILFLLRRSAIMIIIAGFIIIYLYLNKNPFVLIIKSAILFLGISLLILLSPGLQKSINNYVGLYEVRGRALDRSIDDQIESEGRSMEIKEIYKEAISFNDAKLSLIGEGYFVSDDSIGIYGNGVNYGQPMHTMFGQILYYTGFIGLFVYVMMNVKFIKLFLQINKTQNKDKLNVFFKAILLSLILVFIFMNYTKGLLTPSFGVTIMLYMGALFRILTNKKHE